MNLKGPYKNSTSGHLNIYKEDKRWVVRITYNKKLVVRPFPTLKKAIAWRDEYKERLRDTIQP